MRQRPEVQEVLWRRATMTVPGEETCREALPPRRKVDFSDIPESTATQLKAMRRLGRPPFGAEPRQLIAIRVDPDVLEKFREEARRRRVGYQTLINEGAGAARAERRRLIIPSSAIPGGDLTRTAESAIPSASLLVASGARRVRQ